MELFPKFKERGAREIEMVEGLKQSAVSLCRQMKANFERGAYDAIVSDDAGGRIPTLLLSEVYKQVSKRKFHTLFVATGKGYRPKSETQEKVLDEYLKSGVRDSKKVLVVTQLLYTGKTINHLIASLKKSGVEHIDVATTEERSLVFEGSDADTTYVGGTLDLKQGNFAENHTILSGISKSKEYNPRPIRLDRALGQGDESRLKLMNFDEVDAFAGVDRFDSTLERKAKVDAVFEGHQLKELDATPPTAEENKHIQENINRTRKTIKKLAAEVVQEVWSGK